MPEQISKKEIEQFLSRIWAFERLTPEQLRVLTHLTRIRNLSSDQVLWLQGQRVTFFSIVFSGRFRSVRRTSGGSEKLVSGLPVGRHFGLAEMITGATSAVTIIAEQPSTILTMDGKSLRTELLSHADICYRLMQTMARAIFSLTRDLERTSFEGVHTRLARHLLKARPSRVGSPAKIAMSHQELAIQLGTSRETVSRALSDFKAHKLIQTSYRNITVLNRDGLMHYIDDYDQW